MAERKRYGRLVPTTKVVELDKIIETSSFVIGREFVHELSECNWLCLEMKGQHDLPASMWLPPECVDELLEALQRLSQVVEVSE